MDSASPCDPTASALSRRMRWVAGKSLRHPGPPASTSRTSKGHQSRPATLAQRRIGEGRRRWPSSHGDDPYSLSSFGSNVESTFSMMKATDCDALRSKADTAMVNEALCKGAPAAEGFPEIVPPVVEEGGSSS